MTESPQKQQEPTEAPPTLAAGDRPPPKWTDAQFRVYHRVKHFADEKKEHIAKAESIGRQARYLTQMAEVELSLASAAQKSINAELGSEVFECWMIDLAPGMHPFRSLSEPYARNTWDKMAAAAGPDGEQRLRNAWCKPPRAERLKTMTIEWMLDGKMADEERDANACIEAATLRIGVRVPKADPGRGFHTAVFASMAGRDVCVTGLQEALKYTPVAEQITTGLFMRLETHHDLHCLKSSDLAVAREFIEMVKKDHWPK